MNAAIVGCGRVGLATALAVAKRGHRVVAFDSDSARFSALRDGDIPFHEPGLAERLAQETARGAVTLAADLDACAPFDAYVIAVGTPGRANGEPDLSALEAATASVGTALARAPAHALVVVRSTVLPGTTRGPVRRLLEERSGRRAGDFGLCVAPEFLREGSALSDADDPDRVVVGEWDARSGDLALALFGASAPVLRMSLEAAEATKHAANAFLATLISFSNEIAAWCEAIPGADAATVLSGIHLDRRLTLAGAEPASIVSYLRAGSGFGGACLPKDLRATVSDAKHRGVSVPLLEGAIRTNDESTSRAASLFEREVGPCRRKVVAMLGLAAKPGSDDVRESPAVRLARELGRRGARVVAYDPVIRASGSALLEGIEIVGSAVDAARGADALVLGTAWPEIETLDFAALGREMKSAIVFDARSMLAGKAVPPSIRYFSVGTGPKGQP